MEADIKVGISKREATEVQKILNDKKRTEIVPMAQPKGLCLRIMVIHFFIALDLPVAEFRAVFFSIIENNLHQFWT